MPTVYERFARFDQNNPHVYRLFRRFAAEARAAGKERYGAKAIIERLRWEIQITTKSQDPFRIDNDYVAYYARKLAAEDPRFAHFFEFRELKRS